MPPKNLIFWLVIIKQSNPLAYSRKVYLESDWTKRKENRFAPHIYYNDCIAPCDYHFPILSLSSNDLRKLNSNFQPQKEKKHLVGLAANGLFDSLWKTSRDDVGPRHQTKYEKLCVTRECYGDLSGACIYVIIITCIYIYKHISSSSIDQ